MENSIINLCYQDNHIRIFNKDCRAMDELPDNSIQCVITSPPYWGLRKYSGEQELIWGDKDCEHQWAAEIVEHDNLRFRGEHSIVGNEKNPDIHTGKQTAAGFCSLCGAWKGAYGLEPTPEMYIEHTIEILREIRRVLRKDGVVFFNIGDSYAGSWGSMSHDLRGKAKRAGFNERPPQSTITGMKPVTWTENGKIKKKGMTRIGRVAGLKPKDLCLIPFRVAIAAQEPYQEFTIRELKDRAWLAGIVDADGCIGIHHYKRKYKDSYYHQFQPYISVGCSDKETTDRCTFITRMNGTRSTNPPPIDHRGIKSNRPHHEWRIEGENAAKILEDIYPILVVKEKQARLAHAVWRSNQETKGGKSNPIPPKVTEYRLNLWDTIKKCNQREDATVKEPPVPQHIEPGWWVRSVIIWSKPNPMPESVTDRPTESHEYILMLTKSKKYYWDADAVREGVTGGTHSRGTKLSPPSETTSEEHLQADGKRAHKDWSSYTPNILTSRNIRSVWEFPTRPYPEAHFAVFPERLPELCIKASTPEVGCCSKCGAPWERIVKVNRPDDYDPSVIDERYAQEARKAGGSNGTNRPLSKMFKDSLSSSRDTLGWQPTCKCNADKVPSIVLDPFAGAGTTLWVAKKLNRKAVGYEISEEYCKLALVRNRQQALL